MWREGEDIVKTIIRDTRVQLHLASSRLHKYFMPHCYCGFGALQWRLYKQVLFVNEFWLLCQKSFLLTFGYEEILGQNFKSTTRKWYLTIKYQISLRGNSILKYIVSLSSIHEARFWNNWKVYFPFLGQNKLCIQHPQRKTNKTGWYSWKNKTQK